MYNFSTILGQENVVKSLQNSIMNKKVSHAYIFLGEKGMGKKLIANTFAKVLLCEEAEFSCGVCTSCVTFDSKNNPDIIYISTEKKNIGVDEIRTLSNDIVIKPYKYKYRIFIIDEAETMTTQAQNALLKTLEEPPEYAIIMLLSSHLSSFLETIISRSVILKLRRLSEEQISGYIENAYQIEKPLAEVYAAYSQGNLGRAITVSTSEKFMNLREKIMDIITNIENNELSNVLPFSKYFEEQKEDIQEIFDLACMIYRDVLAYKALNSEKYLIQKDKKALIIPIAKKNTINSIDKKIDAIWQAKKQLSQNANFQMVIEVLLLKLKGELI